jgi:hypothetical protein
MILLRIIFHFWMIWEFTKGQYKDQQKNLKEINVPTVYGVPEGYAAKGWLLIKRDTGTYEEGLEMCKANREELFQVELDMDLPDIFEKMDLENVWTSLFKSKSNQITDRDGFAPVTILASELLINNSQIPDSAIDTTKHVVLQWTKETNLFHYVPVANTEKKDNSL